MPRVSIVIPAYNSVSFIRATVESIRAQTYQDFELIVSDHSSTDGTADVLQEYADAGALTLFTTPKGGGAPTNWKAVTERASGEYLKLVCGDDLLAPTILEAQVAALDGNTRAVMTASQRNLIDAQGNQIMGSRGLQGVRPGTTAGRDVVRASVVRGANIFGEPGCVLFRHDAFREGGGWNDEFPFVIDQFSYCNTLLHGDFVTTPGTQASFRVSAGQWSVNLTGDQASQVVGMHHALAERNPGLLSKTDLLLGDTRARLMAHARRLTYLYLGRRMKAAENTEAGR